MKSFLFSKNEIDYLVDIIPGKTSDKVTLMFNKNFNRKVTTAQIRSYKKNHKLKSGVKTLWGNGQKNQYKLPSGQLIPNGEKTRFKKGNKPHNTQPVGTISKKGDGYFWKKIADVKPSRRGWKQLHRLIWEETHGPVPKGMCLIFLNQDKTDTRLENLTLISKS